MYFYIATSLSTAQKIISSEIYQDQKYLTALKDKNVVALTLTSPADCIFEIILPSGNDLIPYLLDEKQQTETSNHLQLKKVKFVWVQAIIAASDRVKHALQLSVAEKLHHLISVNKTLFNFDFLIEESQTEINIPKSNTSSHKRSLPEDKPSSQAKRLKLTPQTPGKIDTYLRKNFQRLDNDCDHRKLLEHAFGIARVKILLTCYTINHETMAHFQLYKLIKSACRRGVKIYIYSNDQKPVDWRILKFFDNNGVIFDIAFTHSKILVVDTQLVAIGSYNWLGDAIKRYRNNSQGTFVCYEPTLCPLMKEDLWNHIIHYRHRQFRKRKQLTSFFSQEENMSSLVYKLGHHSSITYIPNLEQHQSYLQDAMNIAKKRIIICSSFISSSGTFLEDLDIHTLKTATNRGVKIYFVCSKVDPCLDDFCIYMQSQIKRNLQVVAVNDFHAKTIIIDEDEISDGSFNWLSAVRDEESEHHNHEVTFVGKGKLGVYFIQRFSQSNLGREIKDIIYPTEKTIPQLSRARSDC